MTTSPLHNPTERTNSMTPTEPKRPYLRSQPASDIPMGRCARPKCKAITGETDEHGNWRCLPHRQLDELVVRGFDLAWLQTLSHAQLWDVWRGYDFAPKPPTGWGR